ncbi:MAG: hypothetical protein [Caudoviricetes sp.]|nr:MAG: hypothetical protein [Caudoviricetes sp.]
MYDKALNDEVDNNGVEPSQQGAPGWFQGTISELGRAANNIGVDFTRVSARAGETSMRVSSALAASQGQPEYATKLADMAPVDETKLPAYEKPDALNSGAAAILLGDLFQQAPAIAASFVNPAAGFTVGAATGNEQGLDQAQQLGVTGPAAKEFAGLNALEMGVGAALPGLGGFGTTVPVKLASRFMIGGAVNVALGTAGKYSRAAVLDHYGYTQQAAQIRQWDDQAAAAQFILGGLFNLGGGHARVRERADLEANPLPSEAVPETLATEQPSVGTENVQQNAPENLAEPVNQQGRLSREQIKQAKSDVANAQRHAQRIASERAALLAEPLPGSGKELAQARAARQTQLDALDQQRMFTEAIHQNAAARLDAHEAARAVTQAHTDAAMHTAIHDNYVTESGPGLAADARTEAAHVRAMDEAAQAIHEGRAVDVSAHFADDHTMLVHGDLDAGPRERQELGGAAATARTDAIAQAARESAQAEPVPETPQPGVIDPAVQQPFDLVRAQVAALRETHPELADAVAPHIDRIQAEHAAAHQEAEQFDIAAACAISFGA